MEPRRHCSGAVVFSWYRISCSHPHAICYLNLPLIATARLIFEFSGCRQRRRLPSVFIILQLAVYVFLCDFELTNALGILKRLIIMILSSLALSQFILEERFSSLPRFLRALRHVVLSNVQQQQLQILKTRRRLRVFSYFHASSYFSLGGYAKKKPRNESKREENRMEEYKFQFTCPDTPLESSSREELTRSQRKHAHASFTLPLLASP